MEPTKTTAAAILAAGAMIAAAVYFKPMPGRYHMLKDELGIRLDTVTGSVDRCGQVAAAGVNPQADKPLPAHPAQPTSTQIDALRADPSLAPAFDEAFGAGSAVEALRSVKQRIDCAPFENW